MFDLFSQSEGWFGKFGGSFIPETLAQPIKELKEAYSESIQNPEFQKEFNDLLQNYVGRPTPLTYAKRLSKKLAGAKIYLKREDLTHTGAHKINNTVGQILLAQKMGKTRIIAETGAGQHGVATATVAALFGMKCVVYMGEIDTQRQALNVYRMKLLGARSYSCYFGDKNIKGCC